MDNRSRLKPDPLRSALNLAARDRQFRSELLADPRSALFARRAIQIPESFEIRFIERPPGIDALVVLPRFVGSRNRLARKELEAPEFLPLPKK